MEFNAKEKERELEGLETEEVPEVDIFDSESVQKKRKIRIFKVKKPPENEKSSLELDDKKAPKPMKVAKNRKIKVSRSVLEASPLVGWGGTEQESFIRYKMGYFEIVQLKGYNLFGITTQEAFALMEHYGDLARLYVNPFKVVMMHFPVETNDQQRYFNELVQNEEQAFHREILLDCLGEHQTIAAARYNKEFYFCIYGYSVDVLRENVEDFLRCAGGIRTYNITKVKKKKIMYQMNNPGARMFLMDE